MSALSPKAEIANSMAAKGHKRTLLFAPHMSAFGGKASHGRKMWGVWEDLSPHQAAPAEAF